MEPRPEIIDSDAQSGGVIPGSDDAAFRLWVPSATSIPVLVSVPHAGRAYPDSVTDALREPRTTSLRLEDRHVDALARATAAQCGCSLLIAEAPRAIIDLNRAPDDVDWSMVTGGRPAGTRHSLANRRARGGLGLVPRRLPGVGEIWRRPLSSADLRDRIETVHGPYHRALGETLEWLSDRWGAALLIDLHSMPPLRARTPEEPGAEFVVGDRFGASCEPRLSAIALRHFAANGRHATHNRPYSGGYVLDRHGLPLRGVHAMQIEVCRSTYLDARMEETSARLSTVARLLSGLIRVLADEVATLGRDGQMPQAAE